MEEQTAALKRRSGVPSSVSIPANLESIPMIKPRKSPPAPTSTNGHHHCRRLPPSSSSSSPSSSSSVSAAADIDLASFKASPAYTSLKDLLLPSSPGLLSPTPTSVGAASASAPSPGAASTLEISIRNRLVKQAAWAYLQPMASSPSASGRRLLSYFSGDYIKAFLSSIKEALFQWAARAGNWLVDALWLLLCR